MLARSYRDFDAFAGTVIDAPVGKTQDLTLVHATPVGKTQDLTLVHASAC
jgi:hypothetical protein